MPPSAVAFDVDQALDILYGALAQLLTDDKVALDVVEEVAQVMGTQFAGYYVRGGADGEAQLPGAACSDTVDPLQGMGELLRIA